MADTAKLESARLELYLETNQMPIVAGTTGRQRLKLVNLTPLLANFDLSARGVPAEWTQFSQSHVNLFPTWSESVELVIDVPASIPTGHYTLQINVTSSGEANLRNEVRLDLDVSGLTAEQGRAGNGRTNNGTHLLNRPNAQPATNQPESGLPDRSTTTLYAAHPSPTPEPSAPDFLENEPVQTAPTEVAPTWATSVAEPSVPAQPYEAAGGEDQLTPSHKPDELPVNSVEDLVPQLNRVELTMPLTNLKLQAGQSAIQQIDLRNRGYTPDQLELYVQGLPPDWYSFSQRTFNLFPNWTEPIQFSINVPNDTYAAHYPAQLAVIGGQPKQVLTLADFVVEVVELEVVVAPVEPLPGPTNSLPLVAPSLPADSQELVTDASEKPGRTTRLWQRMFKPPSVVTTPDESVQAAYPMQPPYPQTISEDQIEPAPVWNEPTAPVLDDVPTVQPAPAELPLTAEVAPPFSRVIAPARPMPTETTVTPVQNAVEPGPVAAENRTEIETATELTPVMPVEAVPPTVETVEVAENLAAAPLTSPVVPTSLALPKEAEDQSGAAEPVLTTAEQEVSTPPQPSPGEEVSPADADATVEMILPQERLSLAGMFARPGPLVVGQTVQENVPVPADPDPATNPDWDATNDQAGKRSWWQRLTGNAEETEAGPSPTDFSTPAQSPISRPSENSPNPLAAYYNQPTAPASQPSQITSPNPTGLATEPAFNRPSAGPTAATLVPRLETAALFKAVPGPARSKLAGNQPPVKVQITLANPRMTIIAGESIQQEVGLLNQSDQPDDFDLSIEGLPANWYKLSQSSVNLFPNWNAPIHLGISLSNKVRPNTYIGKIVAVSRSQPGVRNEVPLAIEVLAPLRAEARLQPHRARGFRAHYNLVVRNRSMCDATMRLGLADNNSFCLAQFKPDRLVVPAGQSQTVAFTVSLRPKTPGDQARQSQPFQVQISPEWNVAGQPTGSEPLLVEGQYIHESRWAFVQRHPRWFIFGGLLLLLAVLWLWLIVPLIQGAVLTAVRRYDYSSPVISLAQSSDRQSLKAVFVDQKTFTDAIQGGNPIPTLAQLEVRFHEQGQETELRLHQPLFNLGLTMRGQLSVNNRGDLIFKAVDPPHADTFPWLFAPPDQVTSELSKRLRNWLKLQGSPQRIERVEIEGTTLFIRLAACRSGEPACNG